MKILYAFVLLLSLDLSTHAQVRDLNEFINFESTDSLIKIDTTLTGNLWQIGTPSKIFFDSAWSAPNAIITDTINFYPPNNFSAFTIKISDPAWGPLLDRTFFSFNHKFDTDSLRDGGYIEISYDGGVSWINIANDPTATGFYYDWPNSVNPILTNGNPAYTGRSRGFSSGSNGWRQDGFQWCYFPNISDSLSIYLRFVFSSDSIQTNKEGWMIDNIQLMTDICEGIPEIQNDDLIYISPNPTSDELTIQRKVIYDKQQVQVFDFSGRIIYKNSNYFDASIDTQNFANGIYLLKYSNTKSFSIKQFVVQH